ncbi:hypothetical protein F5884DRAFT_444981 [Xylogone sp. PMI_703]|nr:hypothetical protein F5884DRAFT_444981 [Xylogone sp. PMI_703]
MQLLELPNDILCLLPDYISNIEDYTNAASTCRALRNAFATAKPSTILRLAKDSAPTFFSPHPYFLVMATARQVAEWAIGNESRTAKLHEAFQGGIWGLFDLCVEVAGLTMENIRRLHLARFSIINPLEDKIDKMAGDQWYATENFWGGGVSQPATIYCEVSRATAQIIIYGELFASTMQSYLEPEKNLPRFDLGTRLEYIKYCVPDWNTKVDPSTLPTGPYAEGRVDIPEDQGALCHILNCNRWKRLWNPVLDQIGPAFQEEWRQLLWWNAPQTLGLEGMELITTVGLSDAWRDRLRCMRDQIQALDGQRHRPRSPIRPRLSYVPEPVYEFPQLGPEVGMCMVNYWRMT